LVVQQTEARRVQVVVVVVRLVRMEMAATDWGTPHSQVVPLMVEP
jgi:hypothetical protein